MFQEVVMKWGDFVTRNILTMTRRTFFHHKGKEVGTTNIQCLEFQDVC